MYQAQHHFAKSPQFEAIKHTVPITSIQWETESLTIHAALDAWMNELENTSKPRTENDVIAKVDAIHQRGENEYLAQIAAHPSDGPEDEDALINARRQATKYGICKLSIHTPARCYDIDCIHDAFSFSQNGLQSKVICATHRGSPATTIPGHGISHMFALMDIAETYDPNRLIAKFNLVY